MTSTMLAFLILWIVLPFATLSAMRRLDLPPLTGALTLTALLLGGMAILFAQEAPATPADSMATAAGFAVQGYLPLRPETHFLTLFLWLAGAGGIALIAIGLGRSRRSLAMPMVAASGTALLHLGAFVTVALLSLPGERLAALAETLGSGTEAIDLLRTSASTALAAGAVLVLGATLLALVSRIRIG